MSEVTVFKINPQGHDYLFTGPLESCPEPFRGKLLPVFRGMLPGEYLLLDNWHYARKLG